VGAGSGEGEGGGEAAGGWRVGAGPVGDGVGLVGAGFGTQLMAEALPQEYFFEMAEAQYDGSTTSPPWIG